MKKKGLIISTIVMVVVLIASLTTATYAWFNTSAVTKLGEFTVEVVTNNLVKIGVKADNTFLAGAGEDAFRTGTVSYSGNVAGVLGGGTYGTTGNPGLSATLNHNISWGSQNAAIGFRKSTEDDKLTAEQMENEAGSTAATLGIGQISNLDELSTGEKAYVYRANGNAAGTSAVLTDIGEAVANGDKNASPSAVNGDYAYLFLGVAPTKTLTSSELIIMVDGSENTNSTTLGILAAIHVAYRINSAGAWTDKDVFGAKTYADLKSSVATQEWSAGTPSALTSSGVAADSTESKTYNETYGTTAPSTGAAFVRIPLTKLAVGSTNIDQVEILIYIDGTDTDCVQAATNNAQGIVKIFFHAVAA